MTEVVTEYQRSKSNSESAPGNLRSLDASTASALLENSPKSKRRAAQMDTVAESGRENLDGSGRGSNLRTVASTNRTDNDRLEVAPVSRSSDTAAAPVATPLPHTSEPAVPAPAPAETQAPAESHPTTAQPVAATIQPSTNGVAENAVVLPAETTPAPAAAGTGDVVLPLNTKVTEFDLNPSPSAAANKSAQLPATELDQDTLV